MDWGSIWDGAKAIGKSFLTDEVKDKAIDAAGSVLEGYFGDEGTGLGLQEYRDIGLSGKYSLSVQAPRSPTKTAPAGENNSAAIYSARWTSILQNARRSARSTMAKATVASPQTSRIAKKERVTT